jgi:hypothetical protein
MFAITILGVDLDRWCTYDRRSWRCDVRLPLALLVSLLVATPAYAAPILYTFEGSVSLSKFHETYDLHPEPAPTDIATFLDDYWFPGLTTGTFDITGTFLYDSEAPQERPGLGGVNLVTAIVGGYVFTIGTDLGFHSDENGVSLDTSFPEVLNPVPNYFFGEDAWARFSKSNGGFESGEILLVSRGFYFTEDTPEGLSGDAYATWLGFRGPLTNIHQVPEPATVSLLLLVGLPLIGRRR